MGFNLHSLFILGFGLLLCLPPFLALRMFVRSYRRAARRGLPAGRFVVAFTLVLVIFIYNLGALVGLARAVEVSGETFGLHQKIGLGLSWILFWVWLFLAFAFGRELGRGRKPW